MISRGYRTLLYIWLAVHAETRAVFTLHTFTIPNDNLSATFAPWSPRTLKLISLPRPERSRLRGKQIHISHIVRHVSEPLLSIYTFSATPSSSVPVSPSEAPNPAEPNEVSQADKPTKPNRTSLTPDMTGASKNEGKDSLICRLPLLLAKKIKEEQARTANGCCESAKKTCAVPLTLAKNVEQEKTEESKFEPPCPCAGRSHKESYDQSSGEEGASTGAEGVSSKFASGRGFIVKADDWKS